MDGHCSYLIRTQPVRQIVLAATTFNPTTPPRPRPSHSPKVNATTQNALGWWARRRTPNDGDYPAHSSTQRSSNAPTARPQGQQRSEASSQTSSPEAQRGSGTATRPAAPHRFSASPPPRNHNTDVDHTQRSHDEVQARSNSTRHPVGKRPRTRRLHDGRWQHDHDPGRQGRRRRQLHDRRRPQGCHQPVVLSLIHISEPTRPY